MRENKHILWIDTETSGLNKYTNGVHQIGGIIDVFPLSNTEPVEKFNLKMNCLDAGCENSTWMQEGILVDALSVSGVNEETVRSYPGYQTQFNEFINIMSKYVDKFDKEDKFIIAGYNVGFDKDMLEGYAKKVNFKFLFSYLDHRIIDVQSIARAAYVLGLFPQEPKSFKLEDLCNLFEIEIKAHDALSDIEATRELFFKLIEIIK